MFGSLFLFARLWKTWYYQFFSTGNVHKRFKVNLAKSCRRSVSEGIVDVDNSLVCLQLMKVPAPHCRINRPFGQFVPVLCGFGQGRGFLVSASAKRSWVGEKKAGSKNPRGRQLKNWQCYTIGLTTTVVWNREICDQQCFFPCFTPSQKLAQ